MEKLPSSRNRSLVRDLLSQSFGSVHEAATEICRVVRATLGVDAVYVSRIEGEEMVVVAADDVFDSGVGAGARFPLASTFCQRALDGSAPQSVADLAASPYADVTWPRTFGLRSYAMSPLWDGSARPTGTLAVLDRRVRTFGEEELGLLELLGGLMSREQELARSRAREAAHAADLEASDRRYRLLVDDLGDVIVEISAAGQITYVNPAWVELTGIPMEEMAGKDMMEQVHPDDRAIAAEHMVEVLSGADTARVEAAREVRFLAADGSLRWMSVRGRAMFDDTGELAGFLGIMHDITARVEADQRVRTALADAEAARDGSERASRAKSEFLSRMSHELRTPLNAILGFGQLLELGRLEDEDAENVEQILRAGRHLLDLINEVLDVVRIESGVLSLSMEPVEVADIVAQSLDLVRPAATGRGITLRTAHRFDGASVIADRQRLKQVLVNLLSNAVKYNRNDGEVLVTWAPLDTVDTVDTVDTEPAPAAGNGWMRLSVRDTGRGIPEDRLQDAFTPFERLGAENSGIEGTGVGLSLTRTLVDALGGRIGVDSTVGRGSTFWVDLPAAEAQIAAPVVEGQGVELTRTVLYIEDNPSNITLVRRVLARRPHVRLMVVQDGAEAVEAAHRLLPDLVLLDLHLPGMNGAEILDALRASEDSRMRKVPIVVVTADLTDGTERRIVEAGATLFLPKPIDVHRLLTVVDDHLPRT